MNTSKKPLSRKPVKNESQVHLTVSAALQPRTGRIIHLSDLHLDPDSPPGAAHAKVRLASNTSSFDTEALDRFVEELDAESADLLFVSGDLVNGPSLLVDANGAALDAASVQAKRERGMELAAQFIRRLANRLGISDLKSRVVVVPGNHDVDLAAASKGDDPLYSFKKFTADFLTPFSVRPFAIDEDLGVSILALDNTFMLGRSLLTKDGKPINSGAPAFDVKAIGELIKQINAEKKRIATTRGDRFEPFGIAISHYPPGAVPTGEADLEFVEISFGAAQAKNALIQAGFGLFSHGHKHTSYVNDEGIYVPGITDHSPRCVVLGAASLTQAPRGSSTGINRIDFATSTRFGGANLLMSAYNLNDFRPTLATPNPWLLHVPSHLVGTARQAKVLERIDAAGDSRTDISYFGIALPREKKLPALWSFRSNRWTRTFDRFIQVQGMFTGSPQVRELPQKYQVSAKAVDISQTSADGGRSWQIEVTAAADAESVSFTERTWSLNGYALSTEHQLAIFPPPRGKKELLGYEMLAHTVRDPVEELEFFIRFPYAISPSECEVRIDVTVDRAASSPNQSPIDEEPTEDLLRFSHFQIEQLQFIKRLRVTIQRPLVGVTYWVVWKLPPSEKLPVELRFSVLNEEDNRQLEALRKRFLQANNARPDLRLKPSKLLVSLLMPVIEGALIAPKDSELAIYIPVRNRNERAVPIDGVGFIPRLAVLTATYPKGSALWEKEWSACRGVAGRAFSTGKLAWHFGSGHKHQPAMGTPDDWQLPNVSSYEPYGDRDHSILFGVPILSAHSGAVRAVLCIGSYSNRETFTLLADAVNPENAFVSQMSSLIEACRTAVNSFLLATLHEIKP